MDCMEFDKYAPEYAEGLLDRTLLDELDRHRAACRECDELARVHESVLRALNEAPPVQSPVHLRHNILAAVAREEARLAAETSAYRRMLTGALSAAAAFAGIMITAWYFLFRDVSLAPLENAATDVENAWMPRSLSFLQSANEFLYRGFSVPGFDQAVPFYYLAAALGLGATMIWLAWFQKRPVGSVTV